MLYSRTYVYTYHCTCVYGCTVLQLLQVFRANALCTFVSAAARVCINNTNSSNSSSNGVSLCNTLGRFAPIIVGAVAACGGLFLPLNKVIKTKDLSY
jgi:hypothetical protein